MKKFYALLTATAIAVTASAQRKIVLGVNLVSPANNASIPVNTNFTQEFILTNLGPDAIMPTDTLYYNDPTNSQGQVWVRWGYNKPVNDTIHIIKQLSASQPTSGPANYCILATMSNGANGLTIDSFYNDCNAVTFTGGTTSVNDIRVTEANVNLKLNVYPNPSSAVTNLDYTSQNNSEIYARVFDLSGREVMVYNFGKIPAGKADLSLNISGLTNGLYFVEVRQGQFRATGKLNKQ